MMLFFSPATTQIGRSTMITLQELAAEISSTGLMCVAEISYARPRWESWIVAEAKRRTLYTMYMFDNLFNHTNNSPSYRGAELAHLPAPCGKGLWEEQAREAWERKYDLYLANWGRGGLGLGELWPQMGGAESERVERVDRWVEEVDEFGMMMLAVCVFTHGS